MSIGCGRSSGVRWEQHTKNAEFDNVFQRRGHRCAFIQIAQGKLNAQEGFNGGNPAQPCVVAVSNLPSYAPFVVFQIPGSDMISQFLLLVRLFSYSVVVVLILRRVVSGWPA